MKLSKVLLPVSLLLSAVNLFAFSPVVKATNDRLFGQRIFTFVVGEMFFFRNHLPPATPAALIKNLYQVHAKNSGAIVQGKNREILDKYFSKKLADLIWKDVTAHKDEVGVIDFDLFYNAQDINVSKLVVTPRTISENRAMVQVTFNNYNRRNSLMYLLVKENSVWKIADINYGKGETLLNYFDNII